MEKSSVQLRKIELEIYKEMFKRAEPSANFEKLYKKHSTAYWYNEHYLDGITQHQIMDRICMKHKLTINERSIIGRRIRMGCPPSSSKAKNNPYAYGKKGNQ
jgi:predicted alpha-1,6-mannanase (GH76 family)